MSGFFALLDDIATLAKLTLATVDDTASMAVKTSAKVSAAAVDDVAATPQYVTGITPEREIPVIRRIALSSLRNKLLIILPVALVLSWLAPGLLPVALICGGTYLCFEGGEKILEPVLARWLGSHHAHEPAEPVDEDTIVRRATTTDFILSTEIMLLALAQVQGQTSGRRVVVLILIALIITFAVYGLVAALITLDDLGLRLAAQGRTAMLRRLGYTIVRSAPSLFKVIGVIGTVAMLWVGGEILAHNIATLGVTGPHHLISHAAGLAANGAASWILSTATACVFGAVVGSVLTVLVVSVRKLAR